MRHQVRSVLLKLGHVPTACWAVVLSLAALDRAVRSGILYPRWFPNFAVGYGQPGEYRLTISLHPFGEQIWLPVTGSDGSLLGDHLVLPATIYVIAL